MNSKQFPFRFFSAYEVLEQLKIDFETTRKCLRLTKFIVERAVDGVPSQIPTLKFLTPHFLSFICENTHKEFGIKIFEIDMLMIFDLLTLPQGHQFDTRMKMLLAFCSAIHPS